MNLKRIVIDNLKHLRGWSTDQRIVVLSVDDYGNVRLDSKEARKALDEAGMNLGSNRFDYFDALETTDDLHALYDVLSSVCDRDGRHAVLSAFAVPCNMDFEKIQKSGYDRCYLETIPETFCKLASRQNKAYDGAWALWREGLSRKLIKAQFHGREHFNMKVLEEKLQVRDREVLKAIENQSYASISSSGYSTISVSAAFDFWDPMELESLSSSIESGLDRFEEVFGYRATHFNPPCARMNSSLYNRLFQHGIRYVDASLVEREHLGFGKYKTNLNYTGKQSRAGQTICVRNVVFEPTANNTFDSVGNALSQIETAFRWKRPAIVSSHRVNFCGHIDESNRRHGLNELKKLLKSIVRLWPDVIFMSADDLGGLISESNQ